MPVAVRAVSSGATATLTAANDQTFTAPAGRQPGDLLVCVFGSRQSAFTFPLQSSSFTGWINRRFFYPDDGTITNIVVDTQIHTRVADGTSADNLVYTGNFSDGNGFSFSWTILSLSGVDTTTPIDIAPVTSVGTNSVNHSAPSISPNGSDSFLVLSAAVSVATSTSRTYAAPSGMTKQADFYGTGSQAFTQAVFTQALSSSGATGTKTATASATSVNDFFGTAMLAIKAAAVVAASGVPTQPRRRSTTPLRRPLTPARVVVATVTQAAPVRSPQPARLPRRLPSLLRKRGTFRSVVPPQVNPPLQRRAVPVRRTPSLRRSRGRAAFPVQPQAALVAPQWSPSPFARLKRNPLLRRTRGAQVNVVSAQIDVASPTWPPSPFARLKRSAAIRRSRGAVDFPLPPQDYPTPVPSRSTTRRGLLRRLLLVRFVALQPVPPTLPAVKPRQRPAAKPRQRVAVAQPQQIIVPVPQRISQPNRSDTKRFALVIRGTVNVVIPIVIITRGRSRIAQGQVASSRVIAGPTPASTIIFGTTANGRIVQD